VKEEALGRTL